MNNKKKKILSYVLVGIFAILSVAAIVYIAVYYLVMNTEHTGGMKTPHIFLLVFAVIGLLASLFFLDKIIIKMKPKNNSTPEERRQSVVNYNLQKRCPKAEKLHALLSDTVKRHGIMRVRSGFLAYDLLYFLKPNKWFGFTFHEDYRDDFIEVQLGELYHFQDVMPRLYILGEYTQIVKILNAKNLTNSKVPLLENASRNITERMEIIQNTFAVAVENIDTVADDSRRNELSDYLIQRLSTIDELKQLDKNAVVE